MARELVYLDANASTPCDPRVWAYMGQIAREAYGNPGSAHGCGRKARQVLEDSREDLARILEGNPRELIFTSGATESTNLALAGLAAAVPASRHVIATTGGEHPATAEMAQRLCQQGWRRIEIPLDRNGLIVSSALRELPWESLGLLAVIHANNETGVIQDLSELSELCARHAIPWHVDCVQSVGRIPVSVRELSATAVSFGIHKCNGPRGIGGLFLREGVPFVPSMVGGFQESSRRPGTEPVVLVAGMAETLRLWAREQGEIEHTLRELRDQLETCLQQQLTGLVVNGAAAPRLPNTSNISFPGLEGEAILIALDLAGICCSLGSACASGSVEPSPVLLAMGLEPAQAKSSLRFSVHRFLEADTIQEAVQRIVQVVRTLRSLPA
ncbi:MAG: cysteine desulfurase family protein [Planctomycetaceae bacterium]|nr:cysteine desulfurase [Planctomycetaceae bacterium]